MERSKAITASSTVNGGKQRKILFQSPFIINHFHLDAAISKNFLYVLGNIWWSHNFRVTTSNIPSYQSKIITNDKVTPMFFFKSPLTSN